MSSDQSQSLFVYQSSVARGRWALCALDLGLCDPLVTDDATVSRRAVRWQDYLSVSNQTKVAAGRWVGWDYSLGHQGGGACVHLITGAELTQITDTQRLRTPQGEQTGSSSSERSTDSCAATNASSLRILFRTLRSNSASSRWSKDGQHSSISDEYTKYSHRHKQYRKSITM